MLTLHLLLSTEMANAANPAGRPPAGFVFEQSLIPLSFLYRSSPPRCSRWRRAIDYCAALFPRLHPDQIAVVVHVPDRDRRGGVVDPGSSIMRIGLGQDIFGPTIGLRVEAQHAA